MLVWEFLGGGSEIFFLNLHAVIHDLFLPQLCWQRGSGRVVTSTAEEVVGLVYMAFIDGLSYQGTGSTETMLAATRSSLSLAWGSTSAAKHSPGHLSLHLQHSDTGMGQP